MQDKCPGQEKLLSVSHVCRHRKPESRNLNHVRENPVRPLYFSDARDNQMTSGLRDPCAAPLYAAGLAGRRGTTLTVHRPGTGSLFGPRGTARENRDRPRERLRFDPTFVAGVPASPTTGGLPMTDRDRQISLPGFEPETLDPPARARAEEIAPAGTRPARRPAAGESRRARRSTWSTPTR